MNDDKIVLVVFRIVMEQNCPSFKNRKRAILDRSTGHMRTLTEPKVKARMESLENGIVSALLSAYQTIGKGTSTECSLQSWIACSTPENDCWQCVPEIKVKAEQSDEPYVEITIEPL